MRLGKIRSVSKQLGEVAEEDAAREGIHGQGQGGGSNWGRGWRDEVREEEVIGEESEEDEIREGIHGRGQVGRSNWGRDWGDDVREGIHGRGQGGGSNWGEAGEI